MRQALVSNVDGPPTQRERSVNCPRCQGFMVTTELTDVGNSAGCFSGWHCLQCGEVTDPGIKANRRNHLEPRRNGARPPGSVPASASRAKRRK